MNPAVPLLLAFLAACEEAPDEPKPPGACDVPAGEAPRLEVSHYGTFDELGQTVFCGIPPQGGAPYAPFGVRIRGLAPDEAGWLHLSIRAVDVDTGEVVGSGEFHERFLCANAGESAEWWVSSEFHLRFFGYTLDDLHERDIDVEFIANDARESASLVLPADLDCIPGDGSSSAL